MPRKPPIQSREGSSIIGSPPKPSTERQAWLGRWKERAVNALPSRISTEWKVKIREEVEKALARYSPESNHQELLDIVAMIVEKAKTQFNNEETRKQRAERKALAFNAAAVFLDIEVSRLPEDLVGAPKSPRRLHVLASLRNQMREDLCLQLTGDEPLSRLTQIVKEWLASWVIAQNPQIESPSLVRKVLQWGVPSAAAAVILTARVPAVRNALARGMDAVRHWISPLTEVATEVAEMCQEATRHAAPQRLVRDPSRTDGGSQVGGSDMAGNAGQPVRRARRKQPRPDLPGSDSSAREAPADQHGPPEGETGKKSESTNE